MNAVLAVIVLFNRRLDESSTFLSLTNSIRESCGKLSVLVFDNSPCSMYTNEKFAEWDITYIHDQSNPGVSKAYNYGLKVARATQKKWLLLLDQDTTFPKSAHSIYSNALAVPDLLVAPIVKTGNMLLSPYKSWYGHGRPLKNMRPGIKSLSELKVVNSGLMINLELLEKCGGFNEKIKMDFSDLSFLLTAQKYTNKLLVLDLECDQHFFNSMEKNTEQRLNRFKTYCQDLNGIYQQTGNVMYKITGLLRAFKLSIVNLKFAYLSKFYSICLS